MPAATPPPAAPDPGKAVAEISATIIGLLATIQDYLLLIGGGVIALMMILAGIRYMTGDIKSAKSAIAAAITGAVIVTLAYAIIGWVCDTTNASCTASSGQTQTVN